MKPRLINEHLVIKNSKIHGKGIYARKNIPKNKKLIQYVGNIVNKKQGDIIADKQSKRAEKNKNKGAVYVFELNDKYDLDGDIKNNHARYINHSCSPNCRVYIRNNKIWIISKKRIKKTQELTYDYGYDIEEFEKHPCRCNSKNCIGFIVGESNRKRLLNLLKYGKIWRI